MPRRAWTGSAPAWSAPSLSRSLVQDWTGGQATAQGAAHDRERVRALGRRVGPHGRQLAVMSGDGAALGCSGHAR